MSLEDTNKFSPLIAGDILGYYKLSSIMSAKLAKI
jgi:hypothetical protein